MRRTKHYIAYFPDLSEEIHHIRKLHDPKVDLVAPHVTLVFPQSKLPLDELTRHLESVLASTRVFTARFEKVIAIQDGDLSSLFLLPQTGAEEFHHLHQRLYQGPLELELNPEIPYVAHITLGSGLSPAKAAAVAEAYNLQGEGIAITVDVLRIVEIQGVHEPRLIRGEYKIGL